MSDKILVSNLRLHAHHGVFSEENTLGQKFDIDIECTLDTRPFAGDDDYQSAVCYGSLCKIAEDVSNQGPFRLIEKFGHEIAMTALQRYDEIEAIRIVVRKRSAPVSQIVDYLGVDITRTRNDIPQSVAASD
ncbi:MAG: dihydroneopterin aldolase [Pseudomonadota bacterium]